MVGLEQLFLDHDGPASFKKRLTRVIVIMLLLGIIVAIGAGETHEALAMDAWGAVPCTILESRVESIGTGRARENPYHVHIAFAYTVAGRRRVGDKYRSADGGMDNAAQAFDIIRQYPPGAAATCYVNPHDLGQAVLSRPDVVGAKSFLAVSIAVFAIAFWFYCIPQLRGSRQMSTRSLGVFFAVLLICVFGAILTWRYVLPLTEATTTHSWRKVPCTIVESNIVRDEIHGEVSLTLYRTDIHYRYVIDGTEYHSNRFNLTEGSTVFASTREGMAAQFPAGMTSFCFVNPHDPREATLVRRISPGILNGAFVFAVVLLGFWALIMIARGKDQIQWSVGRWLLLAAVTVIGSVAWAQLALP